MGEGVGRFMGCESGDCKEWKGVRERGKKEKRMMVLVGLCSVVMSE